MTFPTFAPAVPPSPDNSRVDSKPRVLVAQFGDGYSQRSVDGVNALVRSGVLQWDILTQSELSTLLQFIYALQGVACFSWTPFGESTAYNWVIDSTNSQAVSVTPVNQTTFKLRLAIRQVFDIAPAPLTLVANESGQLIITQVGNIGF